MWDSKLVSGFAFQPRKADLSQGRPFDTDGGGWIDGSVIAKDGVKLGYRIYGRETQSTNVPHLILIYFHANAELVTDTMGCDVAALYDCGFHVVVCPEFRGYGWSEGAPALRRLCPDADEFMLQLPDILRGLGIEEFRSIVMGRSIGSPCAVHLASQPGPIKPVALIMESGLLSLLDLPLVRQFASAAPELVNVLARESDPLNTKEKLQRVTIPTCIFHGDQDEIVPISQAIIAHAACGSEDKKFIRCSAGHNDLRSRANKEYYKEIKQLCCKVNGPHVAEVEMAGCESFAWAFSCIPGIHKCLTRRGASI